MVKRQKQEKQEAEVGDWIIQISLVMVLAVTPVVFLPWTSELFELNKMHWVYWWTLVIAGAWAMKVIEEGKLKIAKASWIKWLGLFLITQILSTGWSIDRHTSIFGYYGRFHGGLLSTLAYIFLYLAATTHLNKERVAKTVKFSLVLAVGIAFYGIAEHLGIDDQYWVQDVRHRVFATLGQPNWLAGYLAMWIPVGLGLWLNEFLQKKRYRLSRSGWILSYSILYWSLLYTRSRSGFLGLAAAWGTFWGIRGWLSFKSKTRKGGKVLAKAAAVSLGPLVVLSLLSSTPFTPAIFARKTLVNKAGQSVGKESLSRQITPSGEIRKIVWRGAIEAWKHWPLTGSGVETFAYAYHRFRLKEHNLTSEWDFLYNKAHNEYLNFLTTTGILGLGAYLLLIAELVSSMRRIAKDDWLVLGLFAGWTSLLVSNFFGFSTVSTGLGFFLFPGLIWVLMTKKQGGKEPICLKLPPMKSWLRGGAVLLAWGLAAYGLRGVVNFWRADLAYAEAIRSSEDRQWGEAWVKIEKAVRLNPGEPLFVNELADIASQLAGAFGQEGQATLSAQLTKTAIESSDRVVTGSPANVNFWKNRALVFINLAELDTNYFQKAEEALEIAHQLTPTDPKILYNLALVAGRQEEKDKAVKFLEQALELKPDYQDGLLALALFYHEQAIGEKGKVTDKAAYQQAVKYLTKLNELYPDELTQEKLEKWAREAQSSKF